MSYPLIIFGAGASYDSLQLDDFEKLKRIEIEEFRPPLTKELLSRRRWAGKIDTSKYIISLATDAHVGIARFDNNLERYLTYLYRNNLEANNDRAAQLMALRFYLADLFKDISRGYFNKASNYLALINKLKDERINKAVIINYNYDSLFENHIWSPDRQGTKVADYINGNLKIIKIHGSCEWVYEPENDMSIFPEDMNYTSIDFYCSKALNYIKKDAGLKLSDCIKKNSWNFTEKHGFRNFSHYIPAIAIPLNINKSYVCPENHINILKEELKFIDRILIIGWRAEDSFIVDMLNKNFWRSTVKLYIVSGSFESAKAISSKFINIGALEIQPCNSKGFYSFVKNQEFEDFWR